jgi:hypothetical protein
MRVQLLAIVTALAVTTTAASVARAQTDPRVTKSMKSLKAMTGKLVRLCLAVVTACMPNNTKTLKAIF